VLLRTLQKLFSQELSTVHINESMVSNYHKYTCTDEEAADNMIEV